MEPQQIEERFQKIEARLATIEAKLAAHADYIKTDIKETLMDKEEFEKLQDEIDFIDEKFEKQNH